MIKAGMFDVGGVLHDSTDQYIFEDIRTSLGISKKTLHSVWNDSFSLLQEGKISEEEFWRLFKIRVRATKPMPVKPLLLRAFIKHYRRHDDVLRIISKLRKSGLTLAVVSNTIQPHADYQRKIGIYLPFDEVVLSHEVGIRKPDKDIYCLALRRLKREPDEVFFVDDVAPYVEAANTLGIHGILYQNANHLTNELLSLGIVL